MLAASAEFEHNASLLLHSLSNGKAETAVKIPKKPFKMALQGNKDPEAMLQVCISTSEKYMAYSTGEGLISGCL